jgi:hypothetical protein
VLDTAFALLFCDHCVAAYHRRLAIDKYICDRNRAVLSDTRRRAMRPTSRIWITAPSGIIKKSAPNVVEERRQRRGTMR